jgi:hypothetical protein
VVTGNLLVKAVVLDEGTMGIASSSAATAPRPSATPRSASASSEKTTLELRPVYHSKEQRIGAHVLLCWLSLLLIRLADQAAGDTWRNLRLSSRSSTWCAS